jgi:hypothetical protein
MNEQGVYGLLGSKCGPDVALRRANAPLAPSGCGFNSGEAVTQFVVPGLRRPPTGCCATEGLRGCRPTWTALCLSPRPAARERRLQDRDPGGFRRPWGSTCRRNTGEGNSAQALGVCWPPRARATREPLLRQRNAGHYQAEVSMALPSDVAGRWRSVATSGWRSESWRRRPGGGGTALRQRWLMSAGVVIRKPFVLVDALM